jgi:hypothetical protein
MSVVEIEWGVDATVPPFAFGAIAIFDTNGVAAAEVAAEGAPPLATVAAVTGVAADVAADVSFDVVGVSTLLLRKFHAGYATLLAVLLSVPAVGDVLLARFCVGSAASPAELFCEFSLPATDVVAEVLCCVGSYTAACCKPVASEFPAEKAVEVLYPALSKAM